MTTATTLVLGATGKTGRRVVERLSARGVTVRLGSRSGTPPFDWTLPETWPAAVQGVEAVYVSYFPDFIAPGAFDAIRDFTTLAVSSGVSRLVLLSGRGAPEAERCEELVRQSGVTSTIVRASWFSQNFSESFLLEPVIAGEVILPVGDVGEPFVDADDIADVAVAALTEDGHAGKIYEVTGPRLWTFAGAVAEIARAAGRDIRFIQVPIDAYVAALEEAQLPAEMVTIIKTLFTEELDGRNERVTDGITRALGRPPRDFADYARHTAATGLWNGA